MASAAREYLMIVQESALNVPVASPVIWTQSTAYGLANAQAYFCRLDGSNAFTMTPDPVTKQVMYGGGVAKPAYTISDKIKLEGTLKMELSILQAPMWLSWPLVNAAWTSSEPANDLVSCSCYHAIVADNGTVKRRVFGGVKPTSIGLDVSDDSQSITVTIGLIGSTMQGNQFDASVDPLIGVFPIPLETYFPIDPYLYIQSNGHLTIGGTNRTIIDSLSWKCQNAITSKYGNARFLQMIRNMGRTIDLDAKILYSLSPDDRLHYEGLTPQTGSIEFTNGTHSFTLDMHAQCIYTKLKEDLPIDGIYMFDVTSRPMFDAAAGTDLTLTLT